ncbi:MAG TPA: hypothetical protein VL092_03700 [Chitinophagaceae bacterium]|nr:hypothetical protein [Chitinophagaceae bacterium]
MNTTNILYKKTVTKTFKVSTEKINEQRVLSICSMLNAVTAINDEVIVSLLGSLDFGQISIDHFSLDVVSDALLNDVITLDAGIEIVNENRIKVRLEGIKQSSNALILRGTFGFSVREARLLQYSLS